MVCARVARTCGVMTIELLDRASGLVQATTMPPGKPDDTGGTGGDEEDDEEEGSPT